MEPEPEPPAVMTPERVTGCVELPLKPPHPSQPETHEPEPVICTVPDPVRAPDAGSIAPLSVPL